jgi:hypothetical protein
MEAANLISGFTTSPTRKAWKFLVPVSRAWVLFLCTRIYSCVKKVCSQSLPWKHQISITASSALLFMEAEVLSALRGICGLQWSMTYGARVYGVSRGQIHAWSAMLFTNNLRWQCPNVLSMQRVIHRSFFPSIDLSPVSCKLLFWMRIHVHFTQKNG